MIEKKINKCVDKKKFFFGPRYKLGKTRVSLLLLRELTDGVSPYPVYCYCCSTCLVAKLSLVVGRKLGLQE